MKKIILKDRVKIIGGNFEIGSPNLIGKIGIIDSFGTQYTVKGKDTKEVYVSIKGKLYVFNDYHLTPSQG